MLFTFIEKAFAAFCSACMFMLGTHATHSNRKRYFHCWCTQPSREQNADESSSPCSDSSKSEQGQLTNSTTELQSNVANRYLSLIERARQRVGEPWLPWITSLRRCGPTRIPGCLQTVWEDSCARNLHGGANIQGGLHRAQRGRITLHIAQPGQAAEQP